MRTAYFIAALWILGSLAGAPLFAQDCSLRPLSPRVGDVIDPAERAYFNLFPDRAAFASARAHQCSDSTAFFAVSARSVSRGQAPDTLITRTESLDALTQYIDRFERVYRDAERVPWKNFLPSLVLFPRCLEALPSPS